MKVPRIEHELHWLSSRRRRAKVGRSSSRRPLPTWLGVVWLAFVLAIGGISAISLTASRSHAQEANALATTSACQDIETEWIDLPAGISVRVILDEHPTTVADEIRLGDIACLVGDETLVSRLAAVSVGASPLIGTTRDLNIPTLRLRIRQGGINDRIVDIVGPDVFSVRRETAFVKAERLIDAVESALHAALPSGADVALNISDVADVPVPPGEHAVEVTRLPNRLSGLISISVNILVDGAVWRSIVLRADVQVTQPAWVASEQIGRHEPLGPHNMELRPVVVTGSSQPAILDDSVAWRANRVIQAGSLIEQRFVETIPDVQSGERVAIIYEGGAIQVQAKGTLLADAMIDQMVTVRNEDSGRLVSGRLVTPERVVVVMP